MKKFLILFLLFLFFTSAEPAFATQVNLKGKTVVVDPGHGGFDPGAVREGIYEKHINLQIALKLSEYLKENGATLVLTRNSEYSPAAVDFKKRVTQRYDLNKRLELVNKSKANLFVSIHVNTYHGVSRRGAEVFYYPKSEKSRLLAECILADRPQTRCTTDCCSLSGSTQDRIAPDGFLP